jgi:hypothetical protein
MDGQPAEVSCSANSPQVTWLKADLQANPRKCVLAYWHHPRWGNGPGDHDGDQIGTFDPTTTRIAG